MNESKKEIVFLGGKIEIVPAGSYVDLQTGEQKKSTAKVKLGSICDKWGNVSPGVFHEMLLAVGKDPEAVKMLERIK